MADELRHEIPALASDPAMFEIPAIFAEVPGISAAPALDTGVETGAVEIPPPHIDLEVADQIEITRAAEVLGEMPELHPDGWASLDAGGRLDALQNVEATLARLQGRPPVEVVAETLPPENYGGYQPDDDFIRVNVEHLAGAMSVEETVNTIAHEGRHAFQHYALEHPELAGAEQVAVWQDNQAN